MAIIGRDRSGTLEDLILTAGEGPGGEAVALEPLSHGQRSLWFLHHLAPVGGAYNIPAAMRLLSPVDAGALERAFQALIDRHAALRTVFPAMGGEPCRKVAAELDFTLACADVTRWSDERLRAYLAEEAWRPFDLESGPLLRVTLLTGHPGGPVLLLVVHHIVADFWSLAIVMREMPALYREAAGLEPAQLPLPGLPYEEHVRLEQEALAGERGEELLAWWQEALAGLPTLELATDRPRPAVQTYRGDCHRTRLSGELASALRARSRGRHGTLFMTLLAGFQALLARHSGQEDLAVGAPRAGRTSSKLAGTVGYFVNPVVLRGDLAGDPTFAELLERTKDRVLAAFDHGDVPLPLLAEHLQPVRDVSRTPLFQVSFVMQKETRGAEGLTAFALGEEGVAIGPEGFRLETLSVDHPPAPFDLMLHAVERQGGLSFALQYNSDLFDAATAERLMERFELLLRAVAGSPELALSELPILTEAETLQLRAWNGTAGPVCDSSLWELFAAQAEGSAGEVAVVFEGEHVTYRELARRSAALARHLEGMGVGPEVVVGVAAERSIDLVVALLGVVGAGGAYLPLEPSLPAQRLATILEDARPEVLLACRCHRGSLPLDALPAGTRLAWLDDIANLPTSEARPTARPSADNAAYVIYTSGSTGRPKGVVNTHRGILNRLLWFQDAYGLDESEVFVQKTPFGFDVSVPEFFAPLILGARLVVARPEGHRDSRYLIELVQREGITTIHFVPSMLPFFLAEDRVSACRSLRRVLVSGEAVPWEAEQRCLEMLPVPLLNLYGPTEAAVEVTAWACQPASRPRPVPIGRPVRNTQIHVIGRRLEPAPLGAVGELAIGGAQVARGYLNRPDLTAERFVPDPFSETPGARLYRTGDLCRHLPGGEIEYLGRLDDQVKIRGFRIEPREIEIALMTHPEVREAAVVVRQGGNEKSLLACVVTSATADRLRDYLAARLPAYMVPAFAFGEALDRLPNGKLDRRALARWTPAAEPARGIVAPRTPLEELLAGLFAEVLHVERIGVEDDFFEHGGHSLAVMRLAARVREALRVELPLHRVFETPTVAALARAIESAGRSAAPALVPVARDQPLPLSFAQQRLWFLHQMEPESAVYNMPAAIHLRGSLDSAVLADAIGEVVRRHESLRTRFADGPVQVVDPPAPFVLAEIDLAGLASEALRPFDLSLGPLLRASLARLGEDEHVLLLNMHHIVSDGWSLRILARELGEAYGALSQGRAPGLPALEVQYADYAVWQRSWLQGELLESEIAHWRARLAGAPAVLDLPLDRPRPAVMGHQGASRAVALPSADALARRQGVTLFMAVLAAFQALLSRVSRSEDVSVGTPVAGRSDLRTEGLIGFFVNTLVMRADLSGEPSFAELLARVRETALDVYGHQDVPFEKLVEELHPQRDPSCSPLFQVSFVLEAEPPPALRLGDVEGTLWPLAAETEKFDLSLTLGVDAEGLLSGAFGYRTDLFDAATIDRLAGGFARLLAAAIEDPRRTVSELPLVSAAEREQLLVDWSGESIAYQRPYPREAAIHDLFAEQAALRPEAVAVVGMDGSLTYGELRRQAGLWARRLRALGVGPEVRVGVCLDRSPSRIAATLAVLEAGGAYVPLDPSYPRERLAFLVRDSAASVLVTEERWLDVLPETGAAVLCLDRGEPFEAPAGVSGEVPASGLAYVMYTSGSTGEPKGVAVPHRAVVRLVRGTDYARFGPDEVFLQLAPYAFDASTLEIWGALLNGGRVVMPPPGLLSPAELGDVLDRHGVTTLWLTAGLFHQMVEENLPGLAGVRQLLAGGDVLSVPHVRRVLEELPGTRLINGYGPTENTTFTCCHPVAEGGLDGSVPLGRPIANTRVYVLGRNLQPVPAGVAGELFTGGDGLARGYLGWPERTAERFVPDPFGSEPGGRLYRTGDLVRWRASGDLEFLGRIDSQVKVRGFRVEPGEIEAALSAHPWVRDAVVLARKEEGGTVLMACVAGPETGAPEPSALRDFLRERLPDYMLPSGYVLLPSLPLTANGKVDRRALAELRPERVAASAGTAPRTPTEELVAGIFAGLLKVERVGVADDFFALGGHSLLATQVASRVRSVFGVDLPVRTVFESPTVESLAGWIERSARPAREAGLLPVSDERRRILSFAQQRLWILDQLEPGSPLYNIPVAVELQGSLECAALAAAFGEVVRRHEALRTTFPAAAGEPVQVVAQSAGFVLPLVDLQALPEPARQAEESRLGAAEARRPFDLGRGPLLRAALLRSGAGRHALLLTMHHIVSDGWSMGVLVRELGALYPAFRDGRPSPLPDLALQYSDFAVWQRRHLSGEVLHAQLAWWRERLAGAPPVLELPSDLPRPAVRGRGGLRALLLPPAAGTGVTAVSRRFGVTRFMSLLAVFAALLERCSGQNDLVVGTPIAGRNRVETEGLIGFFVNTLPLRLDLSGDPAFGELLERTRETTLAAYAHQELPFERLVEELAPDREAGRPPLVQVVLALQSAPSGPLALPGLDLRVRPLGTGTAKFDLTLVFTESGDDLAGTIEYDSGLFDGAMADRLAGGFARLLAGAVAEPRRRLSELPLLSAAERQQALVEWNDAESVYPREACLQELFAEVAAALPDEPAIVAGSEIWTYRRLDESSNRLARRLRSLGVEPGTPVCLSLERSPELIVGILAVLKAGGAYVPLDAGYPDERLELLLADSGAQLVLVHERTRERLAALAPQVIEIDDRGTEEGSPLGIRVPASSLAYVIYTSGSTGRPKGVAVPHRAVVRLVRETNYARLCPGDRVGWMANISFDAATWEIWGALLNGAALVAIPRDAVLAPAELAALLSERRITSLFLTTALFTRMSREVPDAFAGVRDLLFGGEAIDPAAARRVLAAGPPQRLLHVYGPTESTTYASWRLVREVPEGAATIPIGLPLANTSLHVLDRRLAPVPRGAVGELCIGGDGLAWGYWQRPDLTAERFVPHPRETGGRLYRTGDLVRRLPDGAVEFLGRADHQVKIRGFRVEPGEIETVLLEHPSVREAAVVVLEGPGGREDRRLAAYVSGGADTGELWRYLERKLPGYMVPGFLTALPALPLTPSGKIDRRALLGYAPEMASGEPAAPLTPVEERVAGVFAEVLGVKPADARASFFALGGHSLLAAQMMSRVRGVFGVDLALRALFEAPTVAGLAARIEREARTGDEAVVPVPRDRPLPLSFAQQRLWFLDRLDPGSPLYNIPAAVVLGGRLDVAALSAAFGEVVRRHEALRTSFPEVEGGAVQAIAEPAAFGLPLVDLQGLPAAEREREAGRLAAAEARRPFDLGRGPLLRLTLLRKTAEEHAALVTMHHIVSDGWSMGVLVRELGTLYAAFLDGRPSPLPELALQYADFAAWQRRHLAGELLESEIAWWRERLAGLPPALELPIDHPRPAARSIRGAVHGFAMDGESLAGLNALSQRRGATLFMTLLAGFAALLQRSSGESDLAVGTPIAGRTRMETEPLIGFFINTLALRVDLSGSPTFEELLGQVRETTLAAYAHQELPFDRLIEELAPERDRSRPPIFQVVLALQNASSDQLALPGLDVEVLPLSTGTAKFEMAVVLHHAEQGLSGLVEYSRDLFEAATVGRLAGQLTRLLAEAAVDPSRALAELPILSAVERHQLLSEWNDTVAPFPETTLLHQFFEAAVDRAPASIAAVCAGRELTYAELDARSNRLAWLLRNLGAGHGAPVGVWVERSLDMLIAVLGVLKAGGHYVALDEAWPADRVESILAATAAPAIVAGPGLLPAVEEMRWRLPALDHAVCLAVSEPEPPAEALDPESVRGLWDFVAERAVDRETAGGFVSAFTGEPMSPAEVDEYRDRVLSLAGPWLRPGARVLEIGSGSGLLLWEIASRVAHVTGVDPSPLTQQRNREHAEREGVPNVELLTAFAHELDTEERFDLVLLASTVQFFPGPRYLERVLRWALGRLAPGGAVLVADVLDVRRREELRRAIEERRGVTGRRQELYLDEGFFEDLGASVHHRTEGFPNELRFRYDVLLTRMEERRKRLWTGWHVDRCPVGRLPQVAAPDDIAYVIHTSGSTGEPKGIVVQHRPAANLVDWINSQFEIGPQDRGLFVTSLCFDLSVYDIFGVLGAGGTVHVATREELADPDRLVELLRTGGITLWDSAPAALVQLAPLFPAEPDQQSQLRRVLLSGDWIPVTLPDRVRCSFPAAKVMALGGATEATVWSNWFPVGKVDPDWPSIPYGRPISNARYHVLDAGFAPCPVGVPGDLYIGGDCLCAGYRRPELTARAFLPDPFSGVPGTRVYRTGDRARYLTDGNLEFLGRLDQQVKVRGYRIELGEIEVALARHPGLREAVVLVREERLVAYVVPSVSPCPTAAELRDGLRQTLPEYMIPSAFVTLEELPVTPNGKLDRQALPAPQWSAGAGLMAPRTQAEQQLAAIWSDVLGVPQVGLEDSFFDLGGHSLLATQMVSRVRESFGVELALRTLFERPRLDELAAWIEGRERSWDEAIARVPREEPPVLSFAQQRLWFLDQLEPGSPVYNIPAAVELQGRLDVEALAAAFGELVRRHDVLRTTFRSLAGQPMQAITEPAAFDLPVVDLQGHGEEADRLASAEARRPFDLGRGPLVRVTLLRLDAQRHVALVTLHHIVSDGWSIGILLRELGYLYAAFLEGRPSPLPELAVQYADFAAWQRRQLAGARLESELAWWRERLAGMPLALDLPADRPRPAVRSARGAERGFAIGAETLAGLADLCQRRGATLFMALLAGFMGLLQRYTGQDDLGVGTPIAGRNRVETEPLIGLFVNTLVLRGDLAGDPGFAELLDRVRETTLAAYAQQDLPFERLVEELAPERDLSRPAVVQVLFSLQNAPAGALEMPGLALAVSPVPTGTAKFDLACMLIETERGLEGTIEYSRDLFEPATVERLAGHFARLLGGAAETPGRRLSELPLLSAAERGQLLAEWGDGGALPPSASSEVPLHALFEAQAERTPGAIALVQGSTGERWTYAELDGWAGSLAQRLAALGVGPEVRVGVCLGRSPALVAALLAVLKAGGAYVPLDPRYPRERLAFLLEDAAAPVLITEPEHLDRLPGHRAQVLLVEGSRQAAPKVESGVLPGNLAYLIYTSGSTGRPKGVAIEHRSAVAFARWARTVFPPEDLAGVLAATSIAFDLSIFELFVTLAWGGKVVLAENALELPRLAAASEVTLVNTVPSAMAELVRLGALPESVRTVNLAGEPLKRSLVDAIHEASGDCRVLDLYGPSETTTYSTWTLASRDERREPTIGRPLAGTRALVLDRGGQPVPAGVPGELFLGGAGLARGYLDRPDLTAERFVPDPLGVEPGGRVYRTGDLVRWLPDGRLEYLGRIDHQVKVRGFRIEPGEIAAALMAHPGVRDAAVLAEEGRLVAFVAGEPEPSGLRAFLRERLPEFMLPTAYAFLPSLPLTPNGKVDRQALAKLMPEQAATGAFVAPRTPAEELVAGIFSAVLEVERVGVAEDFFALGGHSLLATRVAARVRSAFAVELPVRAVFEAPTVESLTARIERLAATGERPPVPAPARVSRDQPLVLSFAQERLWFLQQLDPGSGTYNMPVAVELAGTLRPDALAAALAEVARRHETLRTTFTPVDGQPRQRISPAARLPLPLVDLSALADPGPETARLEREHAGQGFDLESGPPAAALLVRLAEDRHRFLLNLHHIVSDGWSIGVLVRELGALYSGSPLPELSIQYADFAVWQREHLAGDAELSYWEERLGGEIALAELPTDRPRPAVQTFSGGSRRLVLPPELTSRLGSFCRGHGVTLFMTLLAATQALLSRHGGEHDVAVGAPVAGRRWGETEGLIGCFLNTLVLRTDLSGSPSFRELAARVRTVTLEAYSHQDAPFEAVLARLHLDRDLSRTPLFQVLFNMLNLPRPEIALPGLDLRVLTPAEVPSKFDMTFYVSQAGSTIGIDLVYNADLFDEARMADVLAQLEMLLAQAVERPDEPVDRLSLVTAAARALLPDPVAPLDGSWIGSVHELFAAQAERAPERPAVIAGDAVWTYGDLLERSRGVAGWLAAHGVRPGDPVAIFAHRGAPLVQAVLGVLTAGAAFTILDPAYPAPRLAEILRQASPRAWVALQAAGPVPDAVRAWLDEAGCPCLELPAPLSAFSAQAPEAAVGPEDLACIGFTSGSTGGPKGILGLHGSLSHFLPAYCNSFGLGPDDRFSLLSGLSHDPLQRDIFTPLFLGAAIVVPDPADIGIAGRTAEWMNRNRVTVAHLTPALGQLLAERPPGGEPVAVPGLRVAILIGEALTRQDVARLRALAPGVTCINLYGATETQRALSFHRVAPEDVRPVLPLGRGLRDVQLLVIQRGGDLAGIGEVGEIAVRSPHLARGYLGDPGLTAERFQLNPFTGAEGDRVYRTGDLGRYLPNGEVAFAGRADFQVKLRGFRIELGEIAAQLASHPGVRDAAVLLRDDLPGGPGLVAYAAASEPLAAGDLHDFLWRRLPSYMVPSAFALLDALPLTPNGKIDRRALARAGWESPLSEDEARALRTPVEEIVAGICAEVLGVPQVGPGDSFFQLGGHSLTGAQVVSRLRQVFRVDLPLRILFEAPTVAGMAAEIERLRRQGAPERPAISSFRRDRSAPPPLSSAQERFWAERQAEARTVASTIPIMVVFEGRLDLACLQRAMQEIVDRHEVLRTTFREGAAGPVQVVQDAVPVRFPIVDLEGIAPGRRREEVQRWSTVDGRSPFDYERGPLFRTSVFRCSEREHVALFTVHHVAFDGWSTPILLGELSALYNAFREGRPSPLRPLAAQYQDFARWQRQTRVGKALEEQVSFWREHLRGAVPVDLSGGRRPARRTFAAGFELFTVPEELERKLDAFAVEQRATLFMTLLAAFKALLHRETGQDDIVVTSLFANRNQVEIENLLGNFFAGLPLRTRLAGARTFRDLLERVRDVTLAAHEHPDILYEPVMEGMSFLENGDRGGLATFRIMFQLAKLPSAVQELSDLKVTRLPFDTGKIRQDLTLFMSQAQRLVGRFKYNRDVLDPDRVARLRDRYLRILETAVADPDRPLAELEEDRFP